MNFASSIQVAVISTFYYTVLIGFLCFTMAKGLSLSGVSSTWGLLFGYPVRNLRPYTTSGLCLFHHISLSLRTFR